jgi:two-component system OmpR family sensor kinase
VADALKVGDVLRVDVEPEDMSIVADRDHVERILINLIENAMKYAPGSPVEIVGRIRGDMGELRVVDHGPGIPPDQRERVFERFTQIEASQTRSVGGTGLGLSIVRSLAEAMEGRADVDETPGGGATFIIDLPVVAARPAPASR